MALFGAGLIIRNCYELLKKAGRINKKSNPVFFLVFAGMCLMWAGWFDMCSLDPWEVRMPAVLKWLGFGAFIFGLILAIGSLIQLRGLENVDRLVTKGLYLKIRHPMYVGFMLWIFGWGLYHGAILSLVIGVVGIVSILHWQRLEEAALEAQFGQDYRKYRSATWF